MKGVGCMSNVKGSAVLFAAVAMMMFLTGCETTKHSEAMSAEQLRALKQASRQGSVTSKDTKQGGGSLAGQSLSEELLSTETKNASSSKSTPPLISGLNPEKPPNPNLQNGGGAAANIRGSGADLGASSHEDEQFARALVPLDEFNSGGRGPGSSFTDSTTDEEVVRLPDLTDPEESMKPLGKSGLRDGGMRDGGMREVGFELGHVYFGFDQFLIPQVAVRTLQGNAQLLNAKYQNSGVLIEGHCDERGTSDYNLVLGERRAKATRDYLIDLGVLGSRIRIVSYGEERPSCTESQESCWQQNRRAHFVLQ